MPITKVQTPDGSIIKVDAPEGATQEQILQFAQSQYQAPKPQPQGLGGRLMERGGELKNIVTGEYDQGIPSSALQVGGQLAGGYMDILGTAAEKAANAAFKATTTKRDEEYMRQMAQKGVDWVTGQPIVQGAVKSGVEFAQEYPEASRNIEAGLNLAGVLPVAKLFSSGLKKTASGVEKISDAFKSQPMTVEAVKKMEKDAYNKALTMAKESGTEVRTGALRNKILTKTKEIFDDPTVGQIDPDVHPVTYKAIDKIGERLGGKTIKPEELENTRRLLDDFINSSKDAGMDTPDTVKLYKLKGAFDEAVEDLSEGDFFKGNKEFITNFKEARKISNIRRKYEPIERIFFESEIAATNSTNELALKNGFRRLAKRKDFKKVYSPDEQFYILRAAKTGNLEGFLYGLDKAFNPLGSGGMGKIGSFVTVGAGAPFGIAGSVAQKRMVRSKADDVVNQILKEIQPPKQTLGERARNLRGTVFERKE